MASLKTQPTDADPAAFIAGVEGDERRADAEALAKLMGELTGAPPVMWGASIVGFGRYRYRYKSGREGEWFRTGFSPRARDFSIYVMPELKAHEVDLARLGKHKTGVCCLYVKRLSDIDMEVLRDLLARALVDLEAWALEVD